MALRKRPAKKSVLRNQRSRRSSRPTRVAIGVTALLVATLATGAFLTYDIAGSWLRTISQWRARLPSLKLDRMASPANISVLGDDLDEDLRAQIRLSIAGDSTASERADARRLLQRLQRQFGLQHAQIYQDADDRGYLRIERRAYVARLAGDSRSAPLLLDSAHVVSLPPGSANDSTNTLPLVFGLLRSTHASSVHEDGTFPVDAKALLALRELGHLLSLLSSASLEVKSVTFDESRGFSGILNGSGTVFVVGREPFGDRIQHLKDLLAQFDAKGRRAARIELDYAGKAFVREAI